MPKIPVSYVDVQTSDSSCGEPEPGSTLPEGSMVISPDEREELARDIDDYAMRLRIAGDRAGDVDVRAYYDRKATKAKNRAHRLREGK